MVRIIFPMITGGWIIFSSEYYYWRHRLWSTLNFRRKAEAGVRIYILLYQDPAGLGLSNYEAAKYLRRFTRGSNGTGNIFTLTHPDSNGPIMWVTLWKFLTIRNLLRRKVQIRPILTNSPLDYADGTLLDHLFFNLMRKKISGYFSNVRKKVGYENFICVKIFDFYQFWKFFYKNIVKVYSNCSWAQLA